MFYSLIFSVFFSLPLVAASELHEWDLAGNPYIVEFGTKNITPDTTEVTRDGTTLTQVEFFIQKNGKNYPLSFQNAQVNNCNGQELEQKIKLGNKFFKVQTDWEQDYVLNYKVTCSAKNKIYFEHDSFSGQVIGIYSLFQKAVEKFKMIDRISFWKSPIVAMFPSDGDYYSYKIVNITKGHYWDVVGHELGHAIYDMADIGAHGGGAHRIDECYTNNLALSEGWASYFSAWLSVPLDDPNAQFEYMVARRAPLQIEHVPADVCQGPKNEWRVYSFLWDIVDQNIDNESLNKAFQNIWDLTFKKNFQSITAMKNHLEARGVDPVLLNVVYSQNFFDQ